MQLGSFNKIMDNSNYSGCANKASNGEPQPMPTSIFYLSRDSKNQFDFKLCSKNELPPKKFDFSGTLFGKFMSTSNR